MVLPRVWLHSGDMGMSEGAWQTAGRQQHLMPAPGRLRVLNSFQLPCIEVGWCHNLLGLAGQGQGVLRMHQLASTKVSQCLWEAWRAACCKAPAGQVV